MITGKPSNTPRIATRKTLIFCVAFCVLIFLDINLERLVVRGLFGLSFVFLTYCAIRCRMGRRDAFAWYDMLVTGVLFVVLSVFSMIAVTATVLYPFLLLGLIAVISICWGFRKPSLKTVSHLFIFIWLPAALYCCLCSWWMNYMQKVIPQCDTITADPCPARVWFNPVQSRYAIIVPEGTNYAAVIYTRSNFWETIRIDDNGPGEVRMRLPGFKGRVAQNKRDGKLYFLATRDIPAERYEFEALIQVANVKKEFATERTINVSRISPFNKMSHVSALYFLEKTRELFVAGSRNEIKIWKEPGLKLTETFNVQNMNPIARYMVKDNIYDIIVSGDRKIYTAEWTGFVSEIDPHTRRVTRNIFLFSPVNALALSRDGGILYALTTSGYLYSISRNNFSITNKTKTPFGARQMIYIKERGLIFIGNYVTGDVYCFNVRDGSVKKVVNAGRRIQGIAYYRGKGLLLISSACGVFGYQIGPAGAIQGGACPSLTEYLKKAQTYVSGRYPDYMFPALNPSVPAFKKYFIEMFMQLLKMRSVPMVLISLAAFAFMFSVAFGAESSKFAHGLSADKTASSETVGEITEEI